MKILNPEVDVVVIENKEIQIRKLGSEEVVVIEGNDVNDLACILPRICEIGIYVDSAYCFFNGKYSLLEIASTLDSLQEMGMLIEADVAFSKSDSLNFLEFEQILPMVWMIRRGEDIIVIEAPDQEEARKQFLLVTRRWKSEEDGRLFSAWISNGCQVFSAQVLNKSDIIASVVAQIKKVQRGGVISFKLVNLKGVFTVKIESRFKLINEFCVSDQIWGRILTKTLEHPFLIPDARKFISSPKEPFGLELTTFSATHGLTSFAGQPFDDVQLGRGSNESEACGKAIMEALERFSGRIPYNEIKGFCLKAKDLINDSFINPSKLACYIDSQYKLEYLSLRPFREDEVQHWMEMEKYGGGKKFVPSEFVFYSYNQNSFEDGKALFWSNSNGIAAHVSKAEALKGAVLEIIERDAIMIWWLNRISPPHIKKTILSERSKRLIRKIERVGYQVEVLDLTLDLFPVAMTVARNKQGAYPYFFCGAASAMNFLEAAEKALLEMELSIWSALQEEVEKTIEDNCLYEPTDHEIFYFNPEKGKLLDFLFEGCEKNEMSCIDVVDIGNYLEAKGYELYFRNITASEIDELNLGIVVIKALIPGLIPITFGFMSEPLGMSRIYELPVELGLRKKAITVEEILGNYQPHFFP